MELLSLINVLYEHGWRQGYKDDLVPLYVFKKNDTQLNITDKELTVVFGLAKITYKAEKITWTNRTIFLGDDGAITL